MSRRKKSVALAGAFGCNPDSECRNCPTLPPTSPRLSRAFSARRSSACVCTAFLFCAPPTRRSQSVEGRTVRETAPHRQAHRHRRRRRDGPVLRLLWLVIHLMIAGRLHWRPPQARNSPAARRFSPSTFRTGRLVLTEAGSKRRASLHLLRGEQALHDIDPGGVEIFSSDLDEFRAALTAGEPHPQARPHRSAPDQRRGQRLLRRDSPRRAASRRSRSRTSSSRKSGSAFSTPRAPRLSLWTDRLVGRGQEKIS